MVYNTQAGSLDEWFWIPVIDPKIQPSSLLFLRKENVVIEPKYKDEANRIEKANAENKWNLKFILIK